MLLENVEVRWQGIVDDENIDANRQKEPTPFSFVIYQMLRKRRNNTKTMRILIICSILASATAFVNRPSLISRPIGGLSSKMSSSVAEIVQEVDRGESLGLPARDGRPLKVIIAGGGVGGLTAALYMLKKGFDVKVYEKTAAFARFGGPIQFASNALSVIKEIDEDLFIGLMEKFTFTGTRTCGIKDGIRADGSFRMTNDSIDYLWNPDAPADWFVKFPLKVRFSP